jgi:putative phosphoserine phosphatase/1-acylglycerol-3-phosphate O-acyltransferase
MRKKRTDIYSPFFFKDNPIYKQLYAILSPIYYERTNSVHVGIEGTRSRTGKLVWPQMGILKYIMEANQDAERNGNSFRFQSCLT